MDSRERILSLLGLSLRGGRLAVGEEPVEAAARARDARLLLLASDAADNTRRRLEHFAQAGQCLWVKVPFTRAELGRALGRNAVAVAALTDVGLAAAVARRLEETNPDAYRETAERLELKAKRAAERQAEQAAHEKNLRRGRKRKAPPETKQVPVRQVPAKEPPRQSGSGPKRPASGTPRQTSSGRKPSHGASRSRSVPIPHSRPVKKGKGSFRKRES